MNSEMHQDESTEDLLDPSLTQPDTMVTFAAVFYAIGGLLTATTGLQSVTSLVFFVLLLKIVPWAQLVFGVALVVIGARVYKTRLRAAQLGVGLASMAFALNLGWLIYGLSNSIFSCAAIMALPLNLGAVVFGILALKPCARAEAVREKLLEEGLELGF